MKKLYLISVFCFIAYFAIAQSPSEIEWEKNFELKKNEVAYSIIETTTNRLIVLASQSKSFKSDTWLISLDNKGEIINKKVFSSNDFSAESPLISLSKGGFVTVAPYIDFNMSNYSVDIDLMEAINSFSIIKYDDDLNEIWKKNFPKTINGNYITDIIQTKDGGFAVVGNLLDPVNSKSQAMAIKINANGQIQWKQVYVNQYINTIQNIIETDDNSFIFVGANQNKSDDFVDAWICKIDNSGNIVKQFFKSKVSTKNSDIVKTAENNYFILCDAYPGSIGSTYANIINIDKDLTVIWEKHYGQNNINIGKKIVKLSDNNYVIAGSTKKNNTDKKEFWLLGIDNNGNQKWTKTYGVAGEDDIANSIVNTFDRGLVLAGYSYSKTNKKDIRLLKLGFSIRESAMEYVKSNIENWQTKGKYEKLSEYNERVNDVSRQMKIYELTNDFFGKIGMPIFLKDIKNADFQYDTENEVFKIIFAYFNPVYVPVPIDEAKSFDYNFKKLKFSDVKFNLLKNNKLEIYQMNIKNEENKKTYFFDGAKTITYNNQIIENDFSPIEIGQNDNQNSKIDIDNNIPSLNNLKNNRYALIIGNANYLKHGSDMVDIKYSINDAKIFRNYASNILGVPNDNNHIYYIEDANATYIKLYIDNFLKLIKSKPNGEFFIYYSGHGTVNENNEAFIVPVGVTSDYINDFGIKLSDLYSKITTNDNKRVVVFLDACFSGGGKNGQLLVNAKTGLRRTPNKNKLANNLLIFAASTEKQISQEYLTKNHGLFTYFLLKNLRNSNKNQTYGQLIEAVTDQVITTSLNPKNSLKQQNPTVNIDPAIKNIWKSWKINP